MKTLIVTLLFAAVTFAQEPQQPQPQPQSQDSPKQGKTRRSMIQKLQADMDQASTRAKFTEEQRKQFDAARATLRQQGERRRKSGAEAASANHGSAREAMQALRGLMSSDAFQAEDKELLRKDLDELRKSGRNRQERGAAKTRKSAA